MALLIILWKSFVILEKVTFNSVVKRIRNGWCKFRDLCPRLALKSLSLGAKCGLCSAYVCNVMFNTWSVKQNELIRLERNDKIMVRWICNILRKGFVQRNLELD